MPTAYTPPTLFQSDRKEEFFNKLLEAVGGNLCLRTVLDKPVLRLTAKQLRDELSVCTRAQVDSLLLGKASVGHTHGISLYAGTVRDSPHEHLVEGVTGIEQWEVHNQFRCR